MLVKGHSDPVSCFNDLTQDLTAAYERKKEKLIGNIKETQSTSDYFLRNKMDPIIEGLESATPMNERLITALHSEDKEMLKKETTQKRKELQEARNAWFKTPDDADQVETLDTQAKGLLLEESEILENLFPLAQSIEEESDQPSSLLWKIQLKRNTYSKDLQKATPKGSCMNSSLALTLLGLALAASYVAHKILEESALQNSEKS